MPHILLAGTVAKSTPFPTTGLPRVSLELDVDGRRYLIIGHDLVMAELEAMEAGDPVSIQGDLIIKADHTGTITGLHIQARATLPLRRRSINRARQPAC